jgi:hypothetical protein
MLYYLPVMAFGSFYLPHERLIRLSPASQSLGQIKHFLFIPGLALIETRLHGSKHGNPASADAARPQGINDQFSAGPD